MGAGPGRGALEPCGILLIGLYFNQTRMKAKQNLKITGKWRFEIRDKDTGELKRVIEKSNIVPNVGLAAFASQMSNQNTRQIGDNLYVALGDDTTPPAAGDTVLGNETTRKAIGSAAFTGGVASIAVFFATTEATGTHREFGLFGDGNTTQATASADTGILFSHVAANVTVSATETLTITFEMTFTYA